MPAVSQTTPKEVIRVKATKYDESTLSESKKFSLDPDLTTFAMLREILMKAFHIKGDFVVSYLVPDRKSSEGRYLPMLSEWNFNTAIYGASDPHLILKVDVKPLETLGLEEWDIIDEDDVTRVANPSTSSMSLMNVGQLFKTNSSKLSMMRRAWLFGQENGGNGGSKSKCKLPMTDAELRGFLDAEGRLLSESAFRKAVFQGGLEPSLRPVVWRHLLSIYPEGLTGTERIAYTKKLAEKYYCLRESWQHRLRQGFLGEELRLLANAVRKDVVRTDRNHPFYAGDEDRNKNLMELFSLLTTYALAHPEVSYCQGMSDLASPLLVVLKDEAQAYICFCALMRRLRDNFSCDGWAMTRKFQHLSELLQYYDPPFYEYLREMHADDLLFCYRWLLLELKREFAFDDVLQLMEVMWASLPACPPPKGHDLDLYDVDLTAVEEDDDQELRIESGPPPSSLSGWSSVSVNNDGSLGVAANGTTDETIGLRKQELIDVTPPKTRADGQRSFVQRPRKARRRPASISSTHSCTGNVACLSGVCPASVVRSLMLNENENTRVHVIKHASYPPKAYDWSSSKCDETFATAATTAATTTTTTTTATAAKAGRRKPIGSRYTIGCWTDDLKNDLSESPSMLDNGDLTMDNGVNGCLLKPGADDGTERKRVDGRLSPKNLERRCSNVSVLSERVYNIRPSAELEVQDANEVATGTVPAVAVASEADCGMSADGIEATQDDVELTLTEIHDICMAHLPAEDSPGGHSSKSSSSSSACAGRSREPSGSRSLTVGEPVSSSKSRHASSSGGTSYVVTNLDSGFSEGMNNTGQGNAMDGGSRASDTNSSEMQRLLDVADTDRDPKVLLPSPQELGDGNAFMLFLCLTLLLQHRDHIMTQQMDFNEIAIYFDKLMRKHNLKQVLKRARILYADYLKSGWFVNASTIAQAVVVSSKTAASCFGADPMLAAISPKCTKISLKNDIRSWSVL